MFAEEGNEELKMINYFTQGINNNEINFCNEKENVNDLLC
jgi:hypothetical protein